MNVSLYLLKIKYKFFPALFTSSDMVKYLQMNKIKIGTNCRFYRPSNITIDVSRPLLLEIGNYVKVTSGVTILSHDYSRSVLRRAYASITENSKRKLIDAIEQLGEVTYDRNLISSDSNAIITNRINYKSDLGRLERLNKVLSEVMEEYYKAMDLSELTISESDVEKTILTVNLDPMVEELISQAMKTSSDFWDKFMT